MARAVLATLASLLAIIGTAPADARRTVVDYNPSTNEYNFATLQGYCDLDGQDCTSTTLPFTVDFGSGATNQAIIYGDGLISFGSAAISADELLSYSGSLAAFPGDVISPMVENAELQDYITGGSGKFVFAQDAKLSILSDGSIRGSWYFTNGTNAKDLLYTALITPVSDGLQVTFNYYRDVQDYIDSDDPITTSGYSLDGAAVQQSTATDRTFVIPATVSATTAVPEPATWMTAIFGFGFIGLTARRRRSVPAC